MTELLPTRTRDELTRSRRAGIDPETMATTAAIVARVERGGVEAVEAFTDEFDERPDGLPLFLEREHLQGALDALDGVDRIRLQRIAGRIAAFAHAQRESLTTLEGVAVPGGRAGHSVAPVQRAGCYAPGGRYPLPSSVLMTAVTARVAGVDEIWVASPRPSPITLAGAAVAGVDGFLVAGGAHAIAAMALGAGPLPPCDIVVGPGNRFVTAAKQLLSGRVGIDMLAGPSELVVLADESANPGVVAADLIAQAEHDPEAFPVLVSTDQALVEVVRTQLATQLESLPTADIARPALRSGGAIAVDSLDEAIEVCDSIAPEHLQLSLVDPLAIRDRLHNYGALFIGDGAAEVFGDYGVGPNHVLPTAGTARYTGGLSVLTFLRVRNWLEIDAAAGPDLIDDTVWLARQEGLEGHARAAEARRVGPVQVNRARG